MSPRAAARLESLGFTKVYDYEAGKSDWLASPLPTEGRAAGKLDAAAMVRGDDIACHLGERLGDVANRVRAAGKNVCIVVNDRHIVSKLLRFISRSTRRSALETTCTWHDYRTRWIWTR